MEDCYYLALSDLPTPEARQSLLGWLPIDKLVVPPSLLATAAVG